MLAQETVQQLQHAPIADRIQAIELLLQSLKDDIEPRKPLKKQRKPFIIQTFNLGTDLQLDREELYAERGL